MKNNNNHAIELAVALIRTSNFIGIDESARNALSNFIESLEEDDLDEMEKISGIDKEMYKNAFFKLDAQNSSYVVLEIDLFLGNNVEIDISDITITGPVKGKSVIKGAVSESNSIKYPYKVGLTFIAEIDRDQLLMIEKSPSLFKTSELDFSVLSKSKIALKSKKFI